MRSRDRYDRRAFLRGLGAGAALLPTLGADRAHAACIAGAPPRRTVFVIWPNGILPRNGIWPVGPSETDFTLPAFMSALEPHKRDLILIDKLYYKFIEDSPLAGPPICGHGAIQGLLTGRSYPSYHGHAGYENTASGPSIDQFIGNGLRQRGYQGLVSLPLGIYIGTPAYATYRGPDQKIVPDGDPYHVFDTLFGGATGGGTSSTPDPNIDKLRKARRSLLDFVEDDLSRFKARLGTDDGRRIDAHLQSIRDIEAQLLPAATASGGATSAPGGGCAVPTIGGRVDVKDYNNVPVVTKLQIDLATAALASDLTRVAVLQLSDYGDNVFKLPFLGLGGQHDIAHAGGKDKEKWDTWVFQQWAYLIDKLKSVKEGAGSLFDNTTVLFLNNMTTGNHEYKDTPCFLAGSIGGTFKTGRSLQVGPIQQNGILIAIANAMGTPTETWGDPSYGRELTVLRG
jgi:hypothetical protein